MATSRAFMAMLLLGLVALVGAAGNLPTGFCCGARSGANLCAATVVVGSLDDVAVALDALCDASRGFFVGAAIVFVPWLLCDCRGLPFAWPSICSADASAHNLRSFAAAARHTLLKASRTPLVLLLLLHQVVAAEATLTAVGGGAGAASLAALAAAALCGVASRAGQKRPHDGNRPGLLPRW